MLKTYQLMMEKLFLKKYHSRQTSENFQKLNLKTLRNLKTELEEQISDLKDMVEQLKAYFARSGANGEIEIYPSVHHGFAFPERWCYDRAAAERHWERLHALYRSTLA